MRISAALPHGVTAFLFEAARQRRELEGRLVDAVEAEGFAEVILPIVDYLEPYEPLLNPASRGELYRFIDRDGKLANRHLALQPFCLLAFRRESGLRGSWLGLEPFPGTVDHFFELIGHGHAFLLHKSVAGPWRNVPMAL